MYFISPSKGRLSFNQVFRDLLAFINEHPEDHYKIIGGNRLPVTGDGLLCAGVILREGKGGRFYYTRGAAEGSFL